MLLLTGFGKLSWLDFINQLSNWTALFAKWKMNTNYLSGIFKARFNSPKIFSYYILNFKLQKMESETIISEYQLLGTAGSIYLFRDLILSGNPESFFLIFCDIFCDLRGCLNDMIRFREKWMKYLVMGVQ